jgi:hypothetical protein
MARRAVEIEEIQPKERLLQKKLRSLPNTTEAALL